MATKKKVVKKKAAAKSKSRAARKPATKKKPVTRKQTPAKKPAAKKKGAGPKSADAKKKGAAAPRPAAQASPVAKAAPSAKASAPAKAAPSAKASAPAKAAPRPAPVVSAPRPKARDMVKREFLIDVAAHIRKAVRDSVVNARGREVVGQATSGDATFKIDKLAEKALLQFLRDAKVPVAYYSEDSGYTTFTSKEPKHLLVIDPIDGTRAAKSGFENCVVSVASTSVIERPRIRDVENGCVMEILGNRIFYAERGGGTRITTNGHTKKPKLSENTDLEMIAWSMTVTARPAELIFPTAAKLIDLTSMKGGFFACNSTSYSLTRLLTNQLDACVDFANRYYRDIPKAVQDHFINAGRGAIMGIAPYDIAASYLIAKEAGCIVTDAYGNDLDNVLLLDTTVANMQSLIAAANPRLHEMLMNFFVKRIEQFEGLLKRRADFTAGRTKG